MGAGAEDAGSSRTIASVNWLCLSALALSILAAFIPWSFEIGRLDLPRAVLEDAMHLTASSHLGVWVILFLAGLLMLVVTPLGGVLELVGSFGAMAVNFESAGRLSLGSSPGECLGSLAAMLAIASMWNPAGRLLERPTRSPRKMLFTISFEKRVSRPGHDRSKWPLDMNAIVVVGLAIGVAALFFDWYSILHGGAAGHRSGASFVDGLSVGLGFWSTIANLGFAMGLFGIGLIISVITPLGAIAQWTAVILASVSVRGYESPQAELGLVLGLASSVTIVVGMLVPIWIPRGSSQSPKMPRLLSFSFRPHQGMLRNNGQIQYHSLARDMIRRILDNVNIVCLAGAFLGLTAVVPGLSGIGFDVDLSFSELMPNGLMFFLIGTLLAFATPWAGFIQMFGFITYILSVSSWYSGPHFMIMYHWVTLDVNLAVISSLIVTSSIFLKIDSGGSRSDTMVQRIVTWKLHRSRENGIENKGSVQARQRDPPKSV